MYRLPHTVHSTAQRGQHQPRLVPTHIRCFRDRYFAGRSNRPILVARRTVLRRSQLAAAAAAVVVAAVAAAAAAIGLILFVPLDVALVTRKQIFVRVLNDECFSVFFGIFPKYFREKKPKNFTPPKSRLELFSFFQEI